MKKLLKLPLILALLFLASSCQRKAAEIIDEPAASTAKRVVKSDASGWMTNVEYNTDGSIKQLTWLYSGQMHQRNFTYGSNQFEFVEYVDGVKYETTLYTLSAGKVSTAEFKFFKPDGTVSFQGVETRIYNNKDECIEMKYTNGESTEYIYDDKGNNTAVIAYLPGHIIKYKSEYQFYETTEKSLAYNYYNTEGLGLFEACRAKNLVKHMKRVNYPANTVDFECDFTYELDADGYVAKGAFVSTLDPTIKREWTFEYVK